MCHAHLMLSGPVYFHFGHRAEVHAAELSFGQLTESKRVCQICAKTDSVATEIQRFSSVTRKRQASQVTVMVKIAI